MWFELVTKIDIDIHKEQYASYDLRRKIEMQHEEFQKMTEREQVPLLKSPEMMFSDFAQVFSFALYALPDIV
ncbi:hypothetical protein VEV11M_43760 (plasmid) [Escherichia coli]|nr:hypothetical protein VEV11M_43760 [Escherichia coli]